MKQIILREKEWRIKEVTINSKLRQKRVVLNDTTEISLKNYLTDLLKVKRTDINDKERKITRALRESEFRLDSGYRYILDFVEETKRLQKKGEE